MLNHTVTISLFFFFQHLKMNAAYVIVVVFGLCVATCKYIIAIPFIVQYVLLLIIRNLYYIVEEVFQNARISCIL